jgi:hypothetical protein
MRCQRVLSVFIACCMPTIALAQSLTLTAASASGDCSGTSFHQSSGPPGRYLAAEWPVADQFPAPINRGRIRCTIRYTVTVPTGHRLAPGGMSGNVNRVALAQLPSLRHSDAATCRTAAR